MKSLKGQLKSMMDSRAQSLSDPSVEHEKMKARFYDGLARKNPQYGSILQYLECVTNPSKDRACRFPDSTSAKTALLSSRQVLEVTCNNAAGTAAPDIGRFFYSVSPTLLNLNPLASDKLANVYVTGGAPVNTTEVTQASHILQYDPTQTWDPVNSFTTVPGTNSYIKEGDPNASQSMVGTQAGYWKDGAISTVRPVAMSVWYENTLSDLNVNGDISICLMPKGSFGGNVAPVPITAPAFSGQGPVQNWENLGQCPGSYTGKVKDGAYAFWVPSDIVDVEFCSVAENAIKDFPYIAVAGQVGGPTAGGVPVTGIVGKLQIETVFEVTSSVQFLDYEKSPCVLNSLEAIKGYLYNEPTAMANDDHLPWWRRLLGGLFRAGQGYFNGGFGPALGAAADVFL